MKPEIKEAWVNALRSGAYVQGIGKLKVVEDDSENQNVDEPRYCCIGVLLDTHADEVKGVWKDWGTFEFVSDDDEYDEIDAEMDSNLLGFFELHKDIQDTLVKMNDGVDGMVKRHSFDEIADYIEKNL